MERDLWLFEGLMKMRFLSTSQLAELYFDSSSGAANKRLRKLAGAGYIRSWVKNLAEDNVYTVTRSGIRALREHTDDLITDTAPTGLDGQLNHLLAINQVRISLARNVDAIGGSIAWWLSDWELRAHHKERIVPDALFRLDVAENIAQHFALEVDNNTRSLRRFVAKMRGYAYARKQRKPLYGHTDYHVLVVGSGTYILDRIRIFIFQTP